jgi:hypothetical protein
MSEPGADDFMIILVDDQGREAHHFAYATEAPFRAAFYRAKGDLLWVRDQLGNRIYHRDTKDGEHKPGSGTIRILDDHGGLSCKVQRVTPDRTIVDVRVLRPAQLFADAIPTPVDGRTRALGTDA